MNLRERRMGPLAAARPRGEVLELDVMDAWKDRLAGDAALSPERQSTSLAVPAVSSDAPRLFDGLLGPAAIIAVERLDTEGR